MEIELMGEQNVDQLRQFLGEMFSDWLDQSSLQKDSICCPNRKISDVVARFEEAVNDSSVDAVIALVGNKVVGTLILDYKPVWLKASKGELLNVAPEYRGQKVASRMIGFSLKRIMSMGARKLILETWYGNEIALKLFVSMGAAVTNIKEGHTITTENWLPMIMSETLQGKPIVCVAAGEFEARSVLTDGLVNVKLKVNEEAYEYTIVRM